MRGEDKIGFWSVAHGPKSFPPERSTVHQWAATPPQAAVCVGQPLRETGTPLGLDHPQTDGRVEVELLRREHRRGHNPQAPLLRERPDGSVYLTPEPVRR